MMNTTTATVTGNAKETKMNANKATHKGHCQACGRMQRLPKGLLSKHGYTVSHGYFSGVCVGAGHRPFEESYDMLPGFIAGAETALTNLVAFQNELRQPATEAKAWFRVSIDGASRYHSRKSEWKVCSIREDRTGTGSEERVKLFRDGDNKWVRFRDERGDVSEERRDVETEVEVYAYPRPSVLQAATNANVVYANWLEHEADSLRRYIDWQKNRIATWKPGTLVPVEVKDDAKAERLVEFAPTDAPY